MFFPFEKFLLMYLHVTMLQRWAKFANDLVRWSILMISAKN